LTTSANPIADEKLKSPVVLPGDVVREQPAHKQSHALDEHCSNRNTKSPP
jgi:hypothetical protein